MCPPPAVPSHAVKRGLILLIVMLAACGSEPSATTLVDGTSGQITTTADRGEAPPGIAARVLEVFDGDSMRVLIDGNEDELRLLGINAPEPEECFADEARIMLAAAADADIVIVGDERDQFGRIVAFAFAGATNLNQWMLAEGGAIAMSMQHELLPDFVAAEQDAVLRGVGLWAVGVCATTSGAFIFEVEFDAPGRDEENPNGEFVVLGNSGAPADLTGWILRDESSTHRFEFPPGTTIDDGGYLVVRSGCGTSTTEELYWCEQGAVWNNTGDTAILIDGSGAYVSHVRYLGD